MQRSSWITAVAACATVVLASTAPAQVTATAPAPEPSAVDAGKRLYTSYCARCHGLNMVTTSAAFFDLRTFPKDDKSRFVESVTKGKRAMPAWGGALKEPDIDLLWTYVTAPR